MTNTPQKYIVFTGLLALGLALFLAPVGQAIDQVFDDLSAAIVSASIR